ncbi:MAG: hypothetical protein UHX00_12380 [Caryophanon sp.]|nr:hypothetical protein [Caryophanon sp.]
MNEQLKTEQALHNQTFVGKKETAQSFTKEAIDLLMQQVMCVEVNEIHDVKEVNVSNTYLSDDIDYMNILNTLNVEFRYGKGAQQTDYLEYTIELFNAYMDDLAYRFKLEQMKGHDVTTFLQAMDVFTLGTMFAKHQYMPLLNNVAIGFLFHDIGKMNVPQAILTKTTALTMAERAIIMRHTDKGKELFCDMGLQAIAYLAKTNRESKYTTGHLSPMSASMDLKLLQIVKAYSKLTLARPYKQQMHPHEAITHMYANKKSYDEDLLYAFVDFLGIFPKDAVVLLSDGSKAVVESIEAPSPLLPKVRLLQTGELVQLPYDFTLTIRCIMTQQDLSRERAFTSLCEAVLRAQYIVAKQHFEYLISSYDASQWYTHIHIPLFKIIKILETNELIAYDKLDKIKGMYCHILKETKVKLGELPMQRDIVLVLVGDDVQQNELIHLFEGVLYAEGMYPIVIRNEKSAPEIEAMIQRLHITQLFIVGNEHICNVPYEMGDRCHIALHELEHMLTTCSYEDARAMQVKSQLQRYRMMPI